MRVKCALRLYSVIPPLDSPFIQDSIHDYSNKLFRKIF